MGLSKEFLEFAASRDWFHAIDLGERQTCGRYRDGVQNKSLLGVFDLLNNTQIEGRDCLDIGTVDGLTAFGLKALGARSVVATDRVVQDSFLRCRDVLGAEVEYAPQLELAAMLTHFDDRRFDLVVCAGVIYHMLNPFTAFQICRQLLRPGGLFIMETAIYTQGDKPVLMLNAEWGEYPERQTYWLPTSACVDGMMKFGGFDVLASRFVVSAERYAVLGRKVAPDRIRNRTELLTLMQESGYTDYGFDIREPMDLATAEEIVFGGERGLRKIGEKDEERIRFPFHAARPSHPLGVRHWEELKIRRPTM